MQSAKWRPFCVELCVLMFYGRLNATLSWNLQLDKAGNPGRPLPADRRQSQPMKHGPDSKVHGANMGPTWVLSDPDGPHVGPLNLAIRGTVQCEA